MIRVGAGAGYSGDRIEPAVELAEKGRLDYLVFECLAERTIALAQQERMRAPELGYDPLLAERMRAVLPGCRAQGIKIVTNMGAANPLAAAHRVQAVARELGLVGLRIVAVTGDARSKSLPDVPTLKEIGIPMSADAFFGLYGPAGMAPDVTARIRRAVADALKQPDVAERINTLGLVPAYGSSDELAATQAAHLKRWEAPIKASGFTAE